VPAFDEYDLRLLQTLADQVAVAIDNARLFSALRDSEANLRALSLRLLSVQEEERRYIAQELHDELGQLLTAIKINLELVRRRLPPDATALLQRVDETNKLTDDVLTSVRTMTVELRPALLDEMGLVAALRWYAKRFEQRTGVEVALDVEGVEARPRPEIETAIYRVVQEALTNVARHAEATQVQIGLARRDGTLHASIRDDGRGFDVDAWAAQETESRTLGLVGIQERALLLNGQAGIESRPGRGTRIWVELPDLPRGEETR
jgi:signal transduction histidine kinase